VNRLAAAGVDRITIRPLTCSIQELAGT
jgi:hypothetical protein